MRHPRLPEPGEGPLEFRDVEDELVLDPEVLRRRREKVLTFLALFAIVAVAAFTAHRIFYTPPPGASELIGIAQRAVRERVPGAALQFVGEDETTVRQIGESAYEVTASFVRITSRGESANYRFVCILDRQPDGAFRAANVNISRMF